MSGRAEAIQANNCRFDRIKLLRTLNNLGLYRSGLQYRSVTLDGEEAANT